MRGIGGEGKVGTIHKIVRENRVSFMGLVETKCSEMSDQRV